MPVSKAQQRAVTKYVKANYDRVELTVPKGKKDVIRTAAAAVGESVNGYINTAVDERLKREKGGKVNAYCVDVLRDNCSDV